MGAEIIPIWGIFILMISYGIYEMILTKNNRKFRTLLIDYADNIHDKIDPLGESIRESNKIHADLADLMEELVDNHGAVKEMSPAVPNLVTGSSPMEIVTNLFISHMMNKRAEHYGSKTQQEWNFSEIPQEYSEENSEFSTEEKENNESTIEDNPTG